MEEPKKINLYRTKDQWNAILLYATGQVLDDVEWNENTCYFIYEQANVCKKIIQDNLKGKVQVNAKSVQDAMATIKGIIYSH